MQTPGRQLAVPGIIGGLGPLAHISFERKLLAESARRGAFCDRDHPVWILVNATDVPDRTDSLAARANDCTQALVRYARLLQGAGADFLIVVCNTAHAFHRQVQARVSIPWIHLVDHAAEAVARHPHAPRRVGILATDGTLSAGLYERSLARFGLVGVAPAVGSATQRRVMEAIYSPRWGVKATGARVSADAQSAVAHGCLLAENSSMSL